MVSFTSGSRSFSFKGFWPWSARSASIAGTVRNSVRGAMMMKRRESSHGYRKRTSGPASCGT
ncbi:hypothetical protein ELI55_38510 [Rhizobium ruizarguesonis]|nr:hypothetical protein ELI55_38510 [Rhizobium ruizarguesonis]TAZ23369.1 hypothetical protein ELH74_38040 [Rhizobium ruizarguesonis]